MDAAEHGLSSAQLVVGLNQTPSAKTEGVLLCVSGSQLVRLSLNAGIFT